MREVKVVSIYFDCKHKIDSNRVGLMEGDRTCPFRGASWEAER